MGILFDYTQAEETEPEMSRLGQLLFFSYRFFFYRFFFFFGGLNKQPFLLVLMQGLLRTGFSSKLVYVCMTFACSCITLIYLVSAFVCVFVF